MFWPVDSWVDNAGDGINLPRQPAHGEQNNNYNQHLDNLGKNNINSNNE